MDAFFRRLVSGEARGGLPALLRPTLAGLSLLYRAGVAARNAAYDRGLAQARRIDVPVISVGNLTLGGTGKTPFVQFICRSLLQKGKRVAVLSRGYRAADGRNDEAILLDAALPGVPHLQGPDRAELAERAVRQFHAEVLVLDDGFQHRRLARDLDIVLIDCTEPFGYNHLFPRGMLREPLSGLRRSDLMVLTRSNLVSPHQLASIRLRIRSVAADQPVLLAEHRPVGLIAQDGRALPLSILRGKSVAAFCGIGNPSAFWRTVESLGGTLVSSRTFADHHRYTANDRSGLEEWLRQIAPDVVLTTQKDLVKLPFAELAGCPLYAVAIEMVLTDSAGELERALDRMTGARATLRRAA